MGKIGLLPMSPHTELFVFNLFIFPLSGGVVRILKQQLSFPELCFSWKIHCKTPF